MNSNSSQRRAPQLEPLDLIEPDESAWVLFRKLLEARFANSPPFQKAAREVFNLFRVIWEYRQECYQDQHDSVLAQASPANQKKLKEALNNCKSAISALTDVVKNASSVSDEFEESEIHLDPTQQVKVDDLTEKIEEYAKFLKLHRQELAPSKYVFSSPF